MRDTLHVRLRARSLDEEHVRAGLGRRLAAAQRLVEVDRGDRVGARDDHHRGIGSRLDRGADLTHELAPRNDLVPREMAAALGRDLVLDVESRHSGRLVRLHGPPHVQRVSVSGVGIGDERHVEDGCEVSRVIRHLAEPREPEVGQAEPRGGGAVAGHVDRRKSRVLNEARRDAVVGAGDDEALLPGHERAKRGATAGHAMPPRFAAAAAARAIRRSSAGCE